MTATPPAALYARVSSAGQRDRHTIASQLSTLPRLAEERGYRLVERYVDDGISGETIEARPAFRRLLQDALAGRFQALFVIDFDRLTRSSDLAQLSLIKRTLREAGVRVITPGQEFDLKDEEHDFVSDLLGILAKREKQKTLSRIKRGIAAKRAAGHWTGGKIPRPYQLDPTTHRLAVDPKDKRFILQLLNLAKTHSARQIQERCHLYPSFVKRLLSRRRLLFLAGHREHEGILIPGNWPAIIDLDLVDRLQDAKDSRRDLRGARPAAKYLLTGLGLFRCGACGHSIGSHKDTKIRAKGRYERAYYRCNFRACSLRSRVVAVDRIDQAVLGNLWTQIARLDKIRAWAARASRSTSSARELARLSEAEGSLQRRRARLVAALEDGSIDVPELRTRIDQIQAKLREIAAQRQAMSRKTSSVPVAELSDLRTIHWMSLRQDEQKTAILTCVEGISFRDTSLYLTYRFPIDPSGGRKVRVRIRR